VNDIWFGVVPDTEELEIISNEHEQNSSIDLGVEHKCFKCKPSHDHIILFLIPVEMSCNVLNVQHWEEVEERD